MNSRYILSLQSNYFTTHNHTTCWSSFKILRFEIETRFLPSSDPTMRRCHRHRCRFDYTSRSFFFRSISFPLQVQQRYDCSFCALVYLSILENVVYYFPFTRFIGVLSSNDALHFQRTDVSASFRGFVNPDLACRFVIFLRMISKDIFPIIIK